MERDGKKRIFSLSLFGKLPAMRGNLIPVVSSWDFFFSPPLRLSSSLRSKSPLILELHKWGDLQNRLTLFISSLCHYTCLSPDATHRVPDSASPTQLADLSAAAATSDLMGVAVKAADVVSKRAVQSPMCVRSTDPSAKRGAGR